MILSGDNIQTLLQQGAITQAQADSLAAANNVSQQPQPQQAAPQQQRFVDNSAMNVGVPKNHNVPDAGVAGLPDPNATPQSGQAPVQNQPDLPDQSGDQMARAQATDAPLRQPGFDVNAYNQSLASRAPQAARGNPLAESPGPTQHNDSLKGTNTLGAGATGGAPQADAGAPGATGPNDPSRLYIPRAGFAAPNLAPEQRLLKSQLGIAGESIGALDKQRADQDKLNQMQEIATSTVGDIQMQNSSALMKEQDENRAAWATAMKRADQQSAEISARASEIASRKIDPNRYWNDMDTAGKVMATMALALGAGGASLGHGQNYALERMKQAIQNDVDAQKSDIETAYKGLGMQQDEAHSSIQRAQVDAAYRDKQTLQHWELLKVQAQGMVSKLQAPIDKQRGDILLGGIDDQIRQNKLGMAQNLYNYETIARRANARPGGPSEQEIRKYTTDRKAEFMEKGDNEQDASDRANKLASERFNLQLTGGQATLPTLENDKTREQRNKTEALQVNLPNGQKAEARSPAAAEEYAKRQMAIGQLASIVKRMTEMRERNDGGTLMNRQDVAEAASLQEQAVNQYNEITGFNRAPGQPERTGLKGDVIPNSSDWSPSGSVDRKLQSLSQFVSNAYDLNNQSHLKNPPTEPYDIINNKPGGTDLASQIGAKPTAGR